jgi:hypothetical protein
MAAVAVSVLVATEVTGTAVVATDTSYVVVPGGVASGPQAVIYRGQYFMIEGIARSLSRKRE